MTDIADIIFDTGALLCHQCIYLQYVRTSKTKKTGALLNQCWHLRVVFTNVVNISSLRSWTFAYVSSQKIKLGAFSETRTGEPYAPPGRVESPLTLPPPHPQPCCQLWGDKATESWWVAAPSSVGACAVWTVPSCLPVCCRVPTAAEREWERDNTHTHRPLWLHHHHNNNNSKMTQVQSSNLLDVLKKKMRQTKEEMEKYKEESEDMARKLQVEIRRREEVGGGSTTYYLAEGGGGWSSSLGLFPPRVIFQLGHYGGEVV